MNLEKAIEILGLKAALLYKPKDKDYHDAQRLGIEALKRTTSRREKLSWSFEPLLPGETID